MYQDNFPVNDDFLDFSFVVCFAVYGCNEENSVPDMLRTFVKARFRRIFVELTPKHQHN